MPPKKTTKVAVTGAEGQELNSTLTLLTAIHQMLADKDIGSVYAIPVTYFQETVVFAPQVTLRFLEKKDDQVDKDNPLIDGLITFRMMNKTSESITVADVNTLIERVRAKFATPPFVWQKGKKCYSYYDKSKGYRMKINTTSESEAKRVIEQVLDLQGHSPEWEFLNLNQAIQELQKFDETPKSKVILSKPRKQVRRRPVGKVTFYRAELHIHGMEPIVLYPFAAIP